MEEKERKPKKKKGCLIALCIVLAVILALAIAATAFLESILGMIQRPDEEEAFMTEEEYMQQVMEEEGIEEEEILDTTEPTTAPTEPTTTVPPSEPELLGGNDQIINILLIGQDRRKEARARSDAMILCTINKQTGTLTMTSIMRDMYVKIPGYQDNRINASYAFGGMKLLNKTIKENLGVIIDGNVEVDFNRFKQVIDAVGGVEVNITKSELNHMKKYYPNECGDLTTGYNLLNGEQALAYSRNRSTGGDGDFGRTNRQRTVLMALADRAMAMETTEVISLIKEVLPMLKTDMSDAEIIRLALEVLPMLPQLSMETGHIPVDGAYRMTKIRGMSVMVPDLEKNREVLKEIMYVN